MKNSIFNSLENQREFKKCFVEIFTSHLNQKRVLPLERLHELACLDFGVSACDYTQESITHWYENIVELKYILKYESDDLQEIIIHSSDNVQVINQRQRLQGQLEISPEDRQLSLEAISVLAQQDWSYNQPFTSFSYVLRSQNYRITLIHHSMGQDGLSKIFLRKFDHKFSSLETLSMQENLRQTLSSAIELKKNILIAGPTGSGKTTLLKSLLLCTGPKEHLVILEDYPEINLKRENTTTLIAQQDSTTKNLKSFCAYAMRMRPDRIVLGEMRGAEVSSFLLSMNTGHKGMMATIHSNSAVDTVLRMATLFAMYSDNVFLSHEQLISLICQNIDMVVYLEDQIIKEVIELRGSEKGVPYYETLFLNAA